MAGGRLGREGGGRVMGVRKVKVAVGVFRDAEKARQAVRELKESGFDDKQVGVVAQEVVPQEKVTKKAVKPAGRKAPSKWEEGAVTGVAAGAGVGALWALGIAAGLLPAIGPIIAGGILASLAASAAGGAAVAGLAGALVGLGIPEEEANYYEAELKAGRTIVTVKAGRRYPRATEVLERNGASTYKRREVVAESAKGPDPREEPARASAKARRK